MFLEDLHDALGVGGEEPQAGPGPDEEDRGLDVREPRLERALMAGREELVGPIGLSSARRSPAIYRLR